MTGFRFIDGTERRSGRLDSSCEPAISLRPCLAYHPAMRLETRTILIAFLLPLVAVTLVPGSARSDDAATPIQWEHDTFAGLADAAADAKSSNRRLLIGVSGGAAC
jgi:hypothetical protein